MTAIKYIIKVGLAIMLMGVVSAKEALAFEFNLNQEAAQRLAMSWQVIKISEAAEERTNDEAAPGGKAQGKPDYSNRLANVAVASIAVVAEDRAIYADVKIVKSGLKTRKFIPAAEKVYPT